jgi:ribosomal protein L24E
MSEKDAIIDFCNALEAAAVKLKHDLGASPEQVKWTWNPDKIQWTQQQGTKGPYEKSEDANNPDFKAMLKDLQEHKGKLQRNRFFYWVFQNGSTVGRKKT